MSHKENETKDTQKSAKTEGVPNTNRVPNTTPIGYLNVEDAKSDLMSTMTIHENVEKKDSINLTAINFQSTYFNLLVDTITAFQRNKLIESTLCSHELLSATWFEYRALEYLMSVLPQAKTDSTFELSISQAQAVLGPMLTANGHVYLSKMGKQILEWFRPVEVSNDLTHKDVFVTTTLCSLDEQINDLLKNVDHSQLSAGGLIDSNEIIRNVLFQLFRFKDKKAEDTQFNSRQRYFCHSNEKNDSLGAKLLRYEDHFAHHKLASGEAHFAHGTARAEAVFVKRLLHILRNNNSFKTMDSKAATRFNQTLREFISDLNLPTIEAGTPRFHNGDALSACFGTSQQAADDKTKADNFTKLAKTNWKGLRDADESRYTKVPLDDLIKLFQTTKQGKNPITVFQAYASNRAAIELHPSTLVEDKKAGESDEFDPSVTDTKAVKRRTKASVTKRFPISKTDFATKLRNILKAKTVAEDNTATTWVIHRAGPTNHHQLDADQRDQILDEAINQRSSCLTAYQTAQFVHNVELDRVKVDNVIDDETKTYIVGNVKFTRRGLVRNGHMNASPAAQFDQHLDSKNKALNGLFKDSTVYHCTGNYFRNQRLAVDDLLRKKADALQTDGAFTWQGYHIQKISFPKTEKSFQEMDFNQYCT